MGDVKRILIADDHDIFREGLKQVISTSTDMMVADEAVNGQDLLGKLRGNDYDAVLLDISMPGRNGLDILVDIRVMKPKLPVLVLSMYPEEQYAIRAFKSGASGYLTKGSTSRELLEALQKVMSGKKHVSPALAELLVVGLSSDSSAVLHGSLSNRELQVLCMIASGKPVSKIADELCLSVKTVSTYRANILAKMSLKNNSELTRYAMDNNLV